MCRSPQGHLTTAWPCTIPQHCWAPLSSLSCQVCSHLDSLHFKPSLVVSLFRTFRAPITFRRKAQLLRPSDLFRHQRLKTPGFPNALHIPAPPSVTSCHPITRAVRNVLPRAPPQSGHRPQSWGSEASFFGGFRIQRRRSREDSGAQHPPAPGPSARRPPSAPEDWGRRVATERQVQGPGLRRPGHPSTATTNPQVRLSLEQQRRSRFQLRVTSCVT